MFPIGGILRPGGVFVEDVVEEHIGTGSVWQTIKFFLDGTFGEAEADCTGAFTLYTQQWWRGAPIVDIGLLFEVRVASISVGVFDAEGAAVGVWVVINDVCWGVHRPGGKGGDPGTDQVVAVMEIRDIATETIQATFNVDLTATKT